jgi:hypothetical protein
MDPDLRLDLTPGVHLVQASVNPMPHERRSETSLYQPVKRYLERLGFKVKGEVCGCDLVAIREGEPPVVVIGELKLSFSLDLVLQAVDRTAACDEVWLAVGAAGRGRLRDPRVRKLCRLLGFGLLGVSSGGAVEVLLEPNPWRPRQDRKRRARLIDEHRKRIGDPALGGSTRQPIMTAYRQQALACAASLAEGATPHRRASLSGANCSQYSSAQRVWMVHRIATFLASDLPLLFGSVLTDTGPLFSPPQFVPKW